LAADMDQYGTVYKTEISTRNGKNAPKATKYSTITQQT
jgi:hypothetical protein